MRMRAYQTLVPLLVVAGVLSVSGCNLLRKKRKPPPSAFDDPSGTSSSSFGDLDAFNRADISRFVDERRLFNETGFVRVITFARTAPNDGGTIVGVLDPDTLVLKVANRFGSTLITFNRSSFPGKRFAGWVPDSAFLFPSTATTTTPTPTPQPVTGISPSGTCSMTLRTSGFIPSTATCSFNENVRSGSPATMFFPCAGGGATARFGSFTFSGTADKNRVSLSNSSLFPFSGCQVRSIQTISGVPPNLAYTYSEFIASGTCKGVSTCTARAIVSAREN